MDSNHENSEHRRSRALRLTFAYDGDNVNLMSSEPVEMRALPSDSLDSYEGLTGFWYELHDRDGRLLYRKVAQVPLRHSVEAFSDDPSQTLHRVPVGERHGVFTVTVPDLSNAHAVSMHAPPAHERHAQAAEIGRFELRRSE